MSASNLGNDYINEENSPIPIPPAKDGWADMERRLNATPPKIRLPLLQKAAMVAGIVVVSGIAFAITYHAIYRSHTHYPPVPAPKQHPALTDTPSPKVLAREQILLADTIQFSSFSLDKYLPAPSGITGRDERYRVTPLVIGSISGNVSKEEVNNAGSGRGTAAAGSNAETAANTVGPDKSAAYGSRTNMNAGIKTTSVVHNANAGTNTTTNAPRTKANSTAYNANAGTNATANAPRTKANSTAPNAAANPDAQAPDPVTATNVKAGTKKTTPAAIAKQPANNRASTATTNNTSPQKNMTDAPATEATQEQFSVSQPSLLLQSLPLTHLNRNALTQRPPESVASHPNKARQHASPQWQLLLQWPVPVPISGSAYYLSGPDGNNQLYRLLVPGIRAVRKWNANAVSLDLTPFTAQTYNNPLIRESSRQNSDSSTDKLKLTLRKEFGASGTVLYHRRIFSQWQVAAGIQLNYWMQQSNDQQTVHYPRWTTTPSDSNSVTIKENIHRAQWKVPLEIYYDARRWQAGLRMDLPLNINRSDSITSRIKTPVQLQLMLRYKLLPRRK